MSDTVEKMRARVEAVLSTHAFDIEAGPAVSVLAVQHALDERAVGDDPVGAANKEIREALREPAVTRDARDGDPHDYDLYGWKP